MEGTDNIAEETDSSKRLKYSEEQIDRISNMPDSVIAHILSFLPTKDAVKTVLVPRFRDCWTFMRSLSFDHCAYHDCGKNDYDDGPEYDERFLNLIHHVLICHESSTIDKFQLKLEFNLEYSTNEAMRDDPEFLDYVSREKRMANKVDSWLCFAVRKKVKVLDLNFMGCSPLVLEESYKLPNIVLNSNNLTELKLAGCGIKPRVEILLKSLKKLVLEEIILNEKMMDEILNGCPLLDELSLINCYGFRRLCFTNPNVKSLIVIIERNSWLEISCPNLISLDIAGSIEYVHLKDLSSLVDASLHFSYHFKGVRKKYDEIKILLNKLANIKIFTACTWCIWVLTIWHLTNLPCPSFRWKSLVLKVCLTKWHLPGISFFLRNSHFLDTLTVYVYPGWNHELRSNEACWIQAYDFDGGNYWNLEKGYFHCLKHSLKTVRIYGYITEPYVIKLVEFLLKNAMVLENMLISSKKALEPIQRYDIFTSGAALRHKDHFTSEKLLEFSQKLLSLPRASPRAIINLL